MDVRTAPPRLLPVLAPYGVPAMGIGTYELRGEACTNVVCRALQMGYRLIDTAAAYRNEELVGAGIRASGVPRDELFIVVKIAMKTMHSAETVRGGILASLQNLHIDYADCVLIHWPGCGGLKPDNAEGHTAARERCWRVMIQLQREHKIRYLGVSNFLPRHFAELDRVIAEEAADTERLHGSTDYPPFPIINQIELHPLCVQSSLVHYCRERGMLLQQYSPLGKGDARLLSHPLLRSIQEQCFPHHTIYDVLLMWGLAQGLCTLVRSANASHLAANYEAALTFFSNVANSCGGGQRSSLSNEQHAELVKLRDMMEVHEDTHLAWYSSQIA